MAASLAPAYFHHWRSKARTSCSRSLSPSPADYLRANMAATGGRPALEPGAVVEGLVERSVVWAGERVGPDERLADAVRAAGTTLYPLRDRAAPHATG